MKSKYCLPLLLLYILSASATCLAQSKPFNVSDPANFGPRFDMVLIKNCPYLHLSIDDGKGWFIIDLGD